MRVGAPEAKVLVAGATGVIGLAALGRFADAGWEVIGLSRRRPRLAVRHCAVDLTSRSDCAAAVASLGGVTHLVYAALVEEPGLVGGWRNHDLMQQNLVMFANVLDPVVASGTLEHVALLQGGKAYGVHLDRAVPVPSKESLPRHPHANFYFLQEDYLREAADAGGWSWTILRPQVVFGESIGSPMNLVPALGAYGAVCRERRRPMTFPGGPPRLLEAADADVVADALVWAASAPAARNEIFNVTNGDVFTWRGVWPAIAAALGVEPGGDEPASWVDDSPRWAADWAAVVDRHRLRAPRDLAEFVGDSFVYADRLFAGGGTGLPALMSTVKIRQAGFTGCIDTEAMFAKWFARFQANGLLPPR